jgi:hypothetical protein
MTTDQGVIKFPGSDEIEIYRSAANTITIKTNGYPDDEQFITINPRDVPLMCRALRNLARQINEGLRAEIDK